MLVKQTLITTTSLLTAMLLTTGACSKSTPPAATPVPAADAALDTRDITYVAGEHTMHGYIAAPSGPGPHPGILVVHEWWGQNEYARSRARQLAALGYVALAVDMYGEGKTADNPTDAGALAGEATADPAVTLLRFNAARATLVADARVAADHIGAVGYCFGGGVVLTAARAGVDLDVAASFHGTLSTKTPMAPGTFPGRVLIATGEADGWVPAADVAAIDAELTAAGTPHEIDVYPGATHAFTNPDATATGLKFGMPIAYNAAADAASWTALKTTLTAAWQ